MVYVPVGKRIIVNNGIGWGNDFHIELGGDVDDWYWRNDEEGYNWSDNVEYIMTNDGLKPTHSTDEDNDNNDEEENDQKPAVPAEPAAPAPEDSSKYHYQPSAEPKDTHTNSSIKAEVKEVKKIKASVNITDITSAFFERFSL